MILSKKTGAELERGIKIAILIGGAILLSLMLLIYLYKYGTYKFVVQPKLNTHAENIERFLHDFESDRNATAGSVLTSPLLSGDDAGSEMNKIVPLLPSGRSAVKTSVPVALTSQLQSSNADWITVASPELNTLNFSWMTANLNYTYWSLWGSESVKQHFSKGGQLAQMPIPDYESLIVWAKARYLHGLENNDLLAAQSEIRHLAQLIESNEHPLATQAALEIYQLETTVSQTAAAKAVEFVAFPATLLQKAKAMTWYLSAALHPATQENFIKKIIKFKEPHFGLCGVLAQYSWIKAVDVFRPLPFNDTSKLLDQYAKTADCRRGYEAYLNKAPQAVALLGGHPFLIASTKNSVMNFLFQDTIGLVVDISSLRNSGLYYP